MAHWMMVGVVAVALSGASASLLAQQGPPELPDEVSEWMEQDQFFRWMGLIQQGDSLFNNGTCTRCHGEDATGGRRAPDLTDEQWDHGDGSLAAIQEVIFWGVRRRDFADETRPFQMNPEGGMNFTREQLQAVTAYVWSLSNGTFIPERGG
jgi:mono/diheme cytochrome c family protein